MRRNLMFAGLLGVMVAAAAPAAQARTADHSPGCSGSPCGTLKVCISDMTTAATPATTPATYVPTNEGSGQFQIEGEGDYYLSKVLNASPPTTFASIPAAGNSNNPDPTNTSKLTAIPAYGLAVNTAAATSFPCIGTTSGPGSLQTDDAGILVRAGLYTIYGGKYNSANCLATVNGHPIEQPGGGLVYAGAPGSDGPANQVQRCHAKIHHFHVLHDDGTSTSNAASPGIGQSVVEKDEITVYVAGGQTTTVFAHMTDDRYPECQESTSGAANRVCEPTPGPTGP